MCVCVPGRAGSCSLLPQRRSTASCMSQLQGRPETPDDAASGGMLPGADEGSLRRDFVFQHLDAGRGRGRLDQVKLPPTSTHRSETFELCLFAYEDSQFASEQYHHPRQGGHAAASCLGWQRYSGAAPLGGLSSPLPPPPPEKPL